MDLDYETGGIVGVKLITLTGKEVTGGTGMAVDPTTNVMYVVLRTLDHGLAEFILATINVITGVATRIGALDRNIADITFDSTGQLYGVVGGERSFGGPMDSETLFKIDKTNGIRSSATLLGNGGAGEVIAYNPTDNKIYHWSGSSENLFDTMQYFETITLDPLGVDTPEILKRNASFGPAIAAVWDPLRQKFIVYNQFRGGVELWTKDGQEIDVINNVPLIIHGIALIDSKLPDEEAKKTIKYWSAALNGVC